MNRYRFLGCFFIAFMAISFLTRSVLLVDNFSLVDSSIVEIVKLYLVGFFYDFLAYFYYIIPFVIYLFLIPSKLFNSKLHQVISLILFFAVVYGVVFNAFSEWFFWDEFGKRFNFIAVDYLVYTNEVIQNIRESYPIPLLLGGIFVITSIIFWILSKIGDEFSEIFKDYSSYKTRFLLTLILLLIPTISFMITNKQNIAKNINENRYNQELSKNGFYSLFSAFRNNELDYYEFYKTKKDTDVLKRYRELIGKNDKFLSNDLNQTLRLIKKEDKEKKHNVMLIMIESLSASYMGIYGDDKNLTPYLDKLTEKSLFFSNFFATGTRTVRGMEAVTVSVPPTAGRSIVKRPDNQNTFGLGWVFDEKGYDNKFIYAGYGYFDNMNEYFGSNGFKIVDRNSFEESEVSFANVWGVCDEDLFDKSLKEADISYTNKQPFFSFIMTTSNHRPYTYPDNKIDIPSHTGRWGGVKYTDYAIGSFLKKAKKKPWFDDTIFVFVADHNGGSSGKMDLPLYRYKIPLIIYAPKLIKPQTIKKVSSQIDLAPTMLSLLNWSYKSKFYGQDVLSKEFKPRALIGTYQKLGLYQDGKITILSPNETVKEYKVEELKLKSNKYVNIEVLKEDLSDVITYYQSASYFYKNHLDSYEK